MKYFNYAIGAVLGSMAWWLAEQLQATVPTATAPAATVSWTAPTTYTDTTQLTAGAIDHYTVSWSNSAGGPSLASVTVKAPATSLVIPVVCGTIFVTVTVTTGTVTGIVYPGATSVPSGPVSYASGINCAPSPPTAVVIH